VRESTLPKREAQRPRKPKFAMSPPQRGRNFPPRASLFEEGERVRGERGLNQGWVGMKGLGSLSLTLSHHLTSF
jgi:hypothetical protein